MYKIRVQSVPDLLSLDISTHWLALRNTTTFAAAQTSLHLHLQPVEHNSSHGHVHDYRFSSAAAYHPRAAVVQRCHRHGHHLLLHQCWSSRPAHHLPGSHLLPVGRLLPTRLHLPVYANLPEQIRPRHRRHLLIPLAHGLHLRRPRLQRAQLLPQRAPLPRLQQEEG